MQLARIFLAFPSYLLNGMRRVIFTSFLVLAGFVPRAQVSMDGLRSRAFAAEKAGNYSEAIAWFTELARQDTDTLWAITGHWQHRIAECHLMLGDTAAWKVMQGRAITGSQFDLRRSKHYWSLSLADHYFREQKPDSALFYLRFAEGTRSLRHGCGTGGFWLETERRYRVMRAYAELRMPDSALLAFQPYAFESGTNNEGTAFSHCHEFEGDYHCQVSLYLRLLERRFGAEAVRREVLALPGRWRMEFSASGNGMVDVRTVARFLGADVPLRAGFTLYQPTEAEKEASRSSLGTELSFMTLYQLVRDAASPY